MSNAACAFVGARRAWDDEPAGVSDGVVVDVAALRQGFAELLRERERCCRGGGNPKGTPSLLLAVCGAPSTITHLGHIVIVLRRSPAPVASSSPSSRYRAEGNLPHPQLDQETEGHHRAERVLNTEVPYVRYLDQLNREDVRLHQPHY